MQAGDERGRDGEEEVAPDPPRYRGAAGPPSDTKPPSVYLTIKIRSVPEGSRGTPKDLYCDPKGSRDFLRILSTEGRNGCLLLGGVRPFHCRTSTLGTFVVQVWSRTPPILGGTKPAYSTVWRAKTEHLERGLITFAWKQRPESGHVCLMCATFAR
jgi:hypothetical protein